VARIESKEGAVRLARAIAADIVLYNSERIARGEDLSSEIREGRELYESRALPEFHPLFDVVLAEHRVPLPASTGTPAPGGTSSPSTGTPAPIDTRSPTAGTLAPIDTSPPSALPAGLFQERVKPREASGRGVLLLAIVLVFAGVGWWLGTR
jgi:hypothetical protein